MTIQKINITNSWTSHNITTDVALWCDQSPGISFATGSTSPAVSGFYTILTAGLENNIFLKSGTTLWLKSFVNSFVLIDDQIINSDDSGTIIAGVSDISGSAGSIGLSRNLQIHSNILDTIQDIQNISTPRFGSVLASEFDLQDLRDANTGLLGTISFLAKNYSSAQIKFGSIDINKTDVTEGSENVDIACNVITDGTIIDNFVVSGTYGLTISFVPIYNNNNPNISGYSNALNNYLNVGSSASAGIIHEHRYSALNTAMSIVGYVSEFSKNVSITAGIEAGVKEIWVKKLGTDTKFLTLDGLNNIVQSFTQFLAPYAQFTDPNYGLLINSGTTIQRNAILNAADSVFYYTKDTNTLDYKVGADWKNLLSTDNVSGTGTITVTDNGDGSITVFGTGGGGTAPPPAFGAYSVINNSAPRPATAGTFGAVPISFGFTGITNENFVSTTLTIGGINTVGSIYIGIPTANFTVNQACVLRSTDGTSFREYYLAIAILRSGGAIETTLFQAYTNTQSVNLFPASVSLNGIVELSTGDAIFTQIMSSNSSANSPVYTITSEISAVAGSALVGQGTWTPTLSVTSGISGSIGVVSSMYMQVGNIVTISQSLQFTASDSLLEFTSDLPVVSNFSSYVQATLMGQSLSTEAGNIGDGQLLNVTSVPSSNTIALTAVVSVGSGTKILNYSAMYEIQS